MSDCDSKVQWYHEVLGWVGTFLCGLNQVPQIWKACETKKAEDLSYAMLVMIMMSSVCLGTYALQLNAWAIVANNALCILFSSFLVALKYKYDKTGRPNEASGNQLDSFGSTKN